MMATRVTGSSVSGWRRTLRYSRFYPADESGAVRMDSRRHRPAKQQWTSKEGKNLPEKPKIPPQQAAVKPVLKMLQWREGCVAGGSPARDEVAVRLRRENRTIPLRRAGGTPFIAASDRAVRGGISGLGVAVSGYGGP